MAQFAVGQSTSFTVQALDSAGNTATLCADDVLSASSSDEAVLSVSLNSDGTGAIQALAEGSATLTVTDTVTSSGAVVTASAEVVVVAEAAAPAAETSQVASLSIVFL